LLTRGIPVVEQKKFPVHKFSKWSIVRFGRERDTQNAFWAEPTCCKSIMAFTVSVVYRPSDIRSVIAGSTGTVITVLILTIGLLYLHVTVLCCDLRIF